MIEDDNANDPAGLGSAETKGGDDHISVSMSSFPPFGASFSSAAGVGSALGAAIAVAENHLRPTLVEIEEPNTGTAAPALITASGIFAVPDSIFEQYRVGPKRRQGIATLLTLDSFIEHVVRFADDHSVVFADNDRAKPTMTAVLDYHRSGSDGVPGFGNHRSHFAFPLSDEWKAWQGQDSTPMKMADFAHFLEDRIIDVMPRHMVVLSKDGEMFVQALPGAADSKIADPAKLMQLATELQIFEASVVREAKNLASGEGAIEFQTEHLDSAGQKLIVPALFVIGIPVFKGGPVYQVLARLRYRKNGGQIVFFYELWRTDRVFDHAFDEAVEKVGTETALPVLIGRDESKTSA